MLAKLVQQLVRVLATGNAYAGSLKLINYALERMNSRISDSISPEGSISIQCCLEYGVAVQCHPTKNCRNSAVFPAARSPDTPLA